MEKFLIFILAGFTGGIIRGLVGFVKNRTIEKNGHFKFAHYVSAIVIFGVISFVIGTKVLASQCRGPDPWFYYSIVMDKINPAFLPEGVNITKIKDTSGIEQYVIDNKNINPIYLTKRIDNQYLIDEPTQYLPLYKLSGNKVYSWRYDQSGWGWYESFSSPFDISSDFFISDIGVSIDNKYEDDRPLVIHVPDQQKFTVYGVYNDIGLDIQNPQDYHKSEADKIFAIDFLINYKLNSKYDPKAGEKNKNRCDKRENSYKGLDISVSESFDSGRRRSSDFSYQENNQITGTKQPDNIVVKSNSERTIINYSIKVLEQFKIILIKFINIFAGK